MAESRARLIASQEVHGSDDVSGINYREWLIGQALGGTADRLGDKLDAASLGQVAIFIADAVIAQLAAESDE